ncbi:MAG: hypothetical protein K0R90_1147 [Oscillospiraceae bacterium]|jgi:hypothetical protein|nr:hypothetical protein [Oscillospiraceae bacterium]
MIMQILSKEKAEETLPKIQKGLNQYQEIMKMFRVSDVPTDNTFQRKFNGFYRLRRNSEFRKSYYTYLYNNRNSNIIFEDVIYYLYQNHNRLEASFSSKLLATINPDMPIWDTYVLQNLGLLPTKQYEDNRISKTIILYNAICNWYNEFLSMDNTREILSLFDKVYPNSGITNVKKIDLLLWQIRKDK